jgi:outer membrane protein assembly factor BamB
MTTDRKGAGTGRGACLLSARQRALFGVASLLALAASAPVPGQATAFDYAPGRVTIKAAVLTLDPATPNPNLTVGDGIMEGLRRASFKPPRWDIVNPRGGSGITAFTPEGSVPYWEVVAPTGVHTDLGGYDLLYLCAADLTAMDAFQVDSILEAVNEGAVLWIDSAKPTATGAAGAGTPWANSPFFFVFTANTLGVAGTDVFTHALLTRPFRIGIEQLPLLGVPAGWDEIDATVNIQNIQPLLRSAPGGPVVAAAGRYGSGGFVVTGGNVGFEIASWTGAGVPDPPIAEAVDVMFGYNVMAWATGWTQSRQSARGAGASIGEVRADLDVKWQSLDVGAVTASPVIDDAGRVFVLSYAPTPTLYCFDSNPAQDIDGDTLADDGVPDYQGEGSADLIWFAALPSNQTPRSSSPTSGTAILAGPAPTDVVLVSSVDPGGGSGTVSCYNAATGAVVWSRPISPYGAGATLVSLSTPVIHNAYVYVLSSEYLAAGAGPNGAYGRAYCFDLATGGAAAGGFWWVYPDPALAPGAAVAAAQYQQALPPVDDPVWVAAGAGRPLLPPVPTPTPSVCNSARYRAGEPYDPGVPAPPPTLDPHLDAVIYFGTPAARVVDTSTGAPVIMTEPWGAEYALVPAPANGATLPTPDPFANNRNHYRLMLDVGGATGVTATTYVYEGVVGPETVTYGGAAPTIAGRYAQYAPAAVEGFLGSIPAGSASTAYYDVDAGCRVLVAYTTASGPRQELDTLPGPVLFKHTYQADGDPTLTPAQRVVSGQRGVAGQSIAESLLTSVLTVVRHPDAVFPTVWGETGRSGAVVALDPATGEKRWEYDPRSAPGGHPTTTTSLPTGATARVQVDGPVADAGSAIIAAASQPLSAGTSPDPGDLGRVFALDPRPDVTLRVRVPIPAGHSAPHSVQMTPAPLPAPFNSLGFSPVVQMADGSVALNWDANPLDVPVVDPACYEVDYANRRITFPAASAENVRAVAIDSATPPAWSGISLGPVYGRMLIVSFAYDANDPVTPEDLSDDSTMPAGPVPPTVSAAERQLMIYQAPDLERWDYTPGVIRLRNHPVAWAGGPAITALLVNGVGVSGYIPGELLVTFGGIDWLPTGLINMDTATFGVTAAPMQRGAEVLFGYSGVQPDGQVTVPNAYDTRELHQVPYSFGRPLAGATAADGGRAAVVGTESMNLDTTDMAPDLGALPYGYVGGYSPTGLVPDPFRTLLVLEWDKVTDHVRGQLVRPAYGPPTIPGVPVVSAAPAVEGDTVVTGSRTLAACPDLWATPPALSYEGTEGGPPYGFASALSPARTVITDNERIVETVGSQLDWECTGTRMLDASWANLAAETSLIYPLDVPVTRRPFSRPAKVVRLSQDDYLATYVNSGGTVERYKVPTYPPEPGMPPVAGVPAGTVWPPAESGVGPGNYLVVDTGNNRVVEIDRKGRQVWPLANYPLPPTATVGSRRPSDGMGFDFYTHPTNTVLDLEGPTDAHRYMAWNAATGTWEMHTVIADPGHYRVIDVITTFDLDAATGNVIQTHLVIPVTPPLVKATTGPRKGEFIRVAYTQAQPLFDPADGTVIGYLCAANNLHELLVVEAGTQVVNPPGANLLPSGSGGTWAMWSWLYELDTDGNPNNDERLIFENIREMHVTLDRDEYGAPYLFLMVVCGQYRGPLGNPLNAPGMPFAGAGTACVEFRVGKPSLDITTPATWVLMGSAPGPAIPYWSYTEADYVAGPLGHLWTPPGEGAPMAKRVTKAFVPVCAQRLSGGRHLITNSRGVVGNLTHSNLPTATDAALFNTPPSLQAEVFEVETRYDPAAPNNAGAHHRPA